MREAALKSRSHPSASLKRYPWAQRAQGMLPLGHRGGEGGRILEHEETTLGKELDYKVHTTQCSDVVPPRFNATHGWIFFLVYKALSVKSLF